MKMQDVLAIVFLAFMFVMYPFAVLIAGRVMVNASEAASERSCDCRCDGADMERTSAALRHTAEIQATFDAPDAASPGRSPQETLVA